MLAKADKEIQREGYADLRVLQGEEQQSEYLSSHSGQDLKGNGVFHQCFIHESRGHLFLRPSHHQKRMHCQASHCSQEDETFVKVHH